MQALAEPLLNWYDQHRRALPWREPPVDPYRVWLSEIMLQQTTVAAVVPYYRAFLQRWPDVGTLARAPLDDVLHAWQGLGYYARARNLHRCAGVVARDLGGRFPCAEEDLLKLPGIGAYTAAALAAIAFDRPATVVDGNVERVVARLFAIAEPLPDAKPALRRLAASLTPVRRPGDFAQAMMDLGATLCLPGKPLCGRCPLAPRCRGLAEGIAGELPRRRRKAARPERQGVAFWAVRQDGAVLFRRRPDSGLLGGLMELPSTGWREAPWSRAEALQEAPLPTTWRSLDGVVEHVFTHFRLRLTIMAAAVEAVPPPGIWCRPEEFGRLALPTVMKKVCRLALTADLPLFAGR